MISKNLSGHGADEKLRQKIRKRVRNQSAFLKHMSVYFTMLTLFIFAVLLIRSRDFVFPILVLYSVWMVFLIFHWLSAFVFNRFNNWEEMEYQKRLGEMGLSESPEEDDYSDTLLEKTPQKSEETDSRWNESDFV